MKAASTAVFKLSGSFKKPGAPQDDRFEPLIEPVSSAPLIQAGKIHPSVRFSELPWGVSLAERLHCSPAMTWAMSDFSGGVSCSH